jgi:hypothetical protein
VQEEATVIYSAPIKLEVEAARLDFPPSCASVSPRILPESTHSNRAAVSLYLSLFLSRTSFGRAARVPSLQLVLAPRGKKSDPEILAMDCRNVTPWMAKSRQDTNLSILLAQSPILRAKEKIARRKGCRLLRGAVWGSMSISV